LLEDFREWGAEAIMRVRTETPAAYLRVCAMMVPKELKLEHSQAVKALSDEQIEQAIEAIQTMLAARAGEAAKVIEDTAEPARAPGSQRAIPSGCAGGHAAQTEERQGAITCRGVTSRRGSPVAP
jgi:hypothetical protein